MHQCPGHMEALLAMFVIPFWRRRGVMKPGESMPSLSHIRPPWPLLYPRSHFWHHTFSCFSARSHALHFHLCCDRTWCKFTALTSYLCLSFSFAGFILMRVLILTFPILFIAPKITGISISWKKIYSSKRF